MDLCRLSTSRPRALARTSGPSDVQDVKDATGCGEPEPSEDVKDVTGCGEPEPSEEEQIALAVERLILEAARQLQQAQPQQAEYLLLEGAFRDSSAQYSLDSWLLW